VDLPEEEEVPEPDEELPFALEPMLEVLGLE
jgi:hypothetical protein